MTEKTNTALEEKTPYSSPRSFVIFVKTRGTLCASPLGEQYSTEMEEGDDNW